MISDHSVFILQIMVEDLLTSGKPEMRVFIDFIALFCAGKTFVSMFHLISNVHKRRSNQNPSPKMRYKIKLDINA